MTEQELIAGFNEGDRLAYEKIYEKYHKALFFFARQLLDNTQEIQDIVAEVFIKLFQRNRTFDNLPKIRSFLYIATKNRCLNYLKTYARREEHHEEIIYLLEKKEDYVESKIVKSELVSLILQEAENLPPVRRKIFFMLYVDGLDNKQIAKELNISVDTVRVQKSRAIATLSAIFTNDKLLLATFMILISKSPE